MITLVNGPELTKSSDAGVITTSNDEFGHDHQKIDLIKKQKEYFRKKINTYMHLTSTIYDA
jgi:hypothetical protein